MCGRFTLFDTAASLAEGFGLSAAPASIAPRYNISPSSEVAVVRVPPAGTLRELSWMRWGLVPSWAKDPAIGNRMINARSETAAEKPAFRAAIRRRRCLVPAAGFYEWKRTNGKKQPYYVRMRDEKVFAIGGLWESWEGGGGAVETCALLTTGPNELLAPIHDRMPVIIAPRNYDLWLSPEIDDPSGLVSLFHPYPSGEMTAYPVGTAVNNPSFDDPRCIVPI